MSDIEGQLTLTDYLKSQIEIKNVMDLTAFINSQGKAQYKQIEDIVSKTYEQNMDSDDILDVHALEHAYEKAEEKNVDFVLFKAMNYDDPTDSYYETEVYSMDKIAKKSRRKCI